MFLLQKGKGRYPSYFSYEPFFFAYILRFGSAHQREGNGKMDEEWGEEKITHAIGRMSRPTNKEL